MSERELLAAADFACQREVWDRCINTSERTKTVIDVNQRFPCRFAIRWSSAPRALAWSPAYVYGLIRQESRFIMDARSHVGASGLMQVMPATARWTAKKIGLTGFTPDQISTATPTSPSAPLTQAGAGRLCRAPCPGCCRLQRRPGRPTNWRNGPVLDAAIWAENVPFAETRDYVKKVLANTTNYAALLTGQPQSLRSRLGTVGPRDAASPVVNADLPERPAAGAEWVAEAPTVPSVSLL